MFIISGVDTMRVIYIGPVMRESAHVKSHVIDHSQIQLSGGSSAVGNNQIIVVPKPQPSPEPPTPPTPPVPPTPSSHIFSSLSFIMTNASKDNNLNPGNGDQSTPRGWTWNYGNYNLVNANLELEFTDWGSLSENEKNQIQNHLENSILTIEETESYNIFKLSLYVLGEENNSNSYVLYDRYANIQLGTELETSYGLPRGGEVVSIPVTIRFVSTSDLGASYRPILPIENDNVLDLSVGFPHIDTLPNIVNKDFFTKVLCNTHPMIMSDHYFNSRDLTYCFPNDGIIPDDIKSSSVQTVADLIDAVYYEVEDSNNHIFYRKSIEWYVENNNLLIPEADSNVNAIIVINPVKAHLTTVTGYLNIDGIGGSGDTGYVPSLQLTLFGGSDYYGGDPFKINQVSYKESIEQGTWFIGKPVGFTGGSARPYINGVKKQVWSLKSLEYPYIQYMNWDITHTECPYPSEAWYIYTSASPSGYDEQSGVQVQAWVADPPWGFNGKIFRSFNFTMSSDNLPFNTSPLNPSLSNPTVKNAYIELEFSNWDNTSTFSNILWALYNCYLNIIRVSETGYVLLLQPNQSYDSENIDQSYPCVLSVYIDSDTTAPLPSDIDDYYPIKTRKTSFTEFTTFMYDNGSGHYTHSPLITVRFIVDGQNNTDRRIHPVVPPYIEGNTISFDEELHVSFYRDYRDFI